MSMAESGHSVSRHLTNKLRVGPPREFICLIGGTSNAFNGWYAWASNGTDPAIAVAGPEPKSYDDIKYYVNFRLVGYDVDPLYPYDMMTHGWSTSAYKIIKAKGWDPVDVNSGASSTHDVYWANFIDSAAHLYARTGRVIAPMRPVEPRRGDIITFLVFFPPYESREKIDWDASPYNVIHKDKLEAAPYWDPVGLAPLPKPEDDNTHITLTEKNKRQDKARKERDQARTRDQLANSPLTEEDLNFYILMRTTSENRKTSIKRPHRNDAYRDYMVNKLLTAGGKDGLLYKTVFYRTNEQLLRYIKTGQIQDSYDEVHVQTMPEGRPPKKDIHGRPLHGVPAWFSIWDGQPNVDRKHIRICRFDFFGHSGFSSLLMDFGSENLKGEVPRAHLPLTANQLIEAFQDKVLTPDAHACLWGCHLGMDPPNGESFASKLADVFPQGVVAADSTTSFERIVDDETALPIPENGNWTYFAHGS